MSVYSVEKITPELWDTFLAEQESTLFVQSSTFGTLYEALQEHFFIAGVFNWDRTLVAGALVLTTHARRGDFLYIPYGPVIKNEEAWGEVLQALTAFLKAYAQVHSYDFIRISPFVSDTPSFSTLFCSLGYRPAPMHMLAENTWLLSLEEPLDHIRSAMKKNHRNLLNRLEKADIRVVQTTDSAALKRLNDMHDVVAQRHKFHRFSRSFIEKEFTLFAQRGEATLFEAYLPNGEIDASAIIIFFGSMACYRHSASLNHDSYLPTSYLIQWHVIQEAKKRGMRWYNFWGVAPEDAGKSHPFYGISHFKKGFGGMQKNLLHCQDLPISSRYWVNWLIETLRRKKRGF